MPEELSQVEREIAEALEAARHEAVAVLTLRAYGSEILGFLLSDLRDAQQAEEVFSAFAEDLWKAIPCVQLRTTMRAYAYTLARNARSRYLERDLRKQRRGIPLSQAGEVSNIVQAVRTQTAAHQQTAVQQQLAELRARLSPDEQALLTLRLDRKLGWREIAEVLGDDDEDLARASARLRKRYQGLKQKLTDWAREQGLLGDE